MAEELTPPTYHRTWVRPPKAETSGRFVRHLDVVQLFKNAAMYRREADGLHQVECPWISQHSSDSGTDTAVWEGEWPQFHCFHSHCADRDIRDVIKFFGENNAVA